MTDTMPEQTDWSDVEGQAAPEGASFPEMPANPHNHLYTISMDGRGPMIVVRGNSPAEINERFQALMDAGTTTIAASVYSHLKAEMGLAQGLGPVSPAPAGPPAMPGAPTPPPFGPNVSVPGAPGFQGAPAMPAMPAMPAAPAAPPSEYAQHGWYILDVPFPQKDKFDAIVAQYQMKKGRPTEGGHYSWNKGDKSGSKGWHVHPQYAAAFPQFSPVPA